MYLTQITAEQVSDPLYELFCQVRVRWAYGDQMPDVIEFWWQGGQQRKLGADPASRQRGGGQPGRGAGNRPRLPPHGG
jgi:hypothetical protein